MKILLYFVVSLLKTEDPVRFFKYSARILWISIYQILSIPAGIFLFKVNNGNARTMCENLLKVDNKNAGTMPLVSFWLTLNRFHTLFCCFHRWIWTRKCQLEYGWSSLTLITKDTCEEWEFADVKSSKFISNCWPCATRSNRYLL